MITIAMRPMDPSTFNHTTPSDRHTSETNPRNIAVMKA